MLATIRIIPACAGRPSGVTRTVRFPRDHPRVCGAARTPGLARAGVTDDRTAVGHAVDGVAHHDLHTVALTATFVFVDGNGHGVLSLAHGGLVADLRG
jgi:hypothetical protein